MHQGSKAYFQHIATLFGGFWHGLVPEQSIIYSRPMAGVVQEVMQSLLDYQIGSSMLLNSLCLHEAWLTPCCILRKQPLPTTHVCNLAS
jgi:hypothetical protein